MPVVCRIVFPVPPPRPHSAYDRPKDQPQLTRVTKRSLRIQVLVTSRHDNKIGSKQQKQERASKQHHQQPQQQEKLFGPTGALNPLCMIILNTPPPEPSLTEFSPLPSPSFTSKTKTNNLYTHITYLRASRFSRVMSARPYGLCSGAFSAEGSVNSESPSTRCARSDTYRWSFSPFSRMQSGRE